MIVLVFTILVKVKKLNKTEDILRQSWYLNETYSQVHKYWDIDTILTFLALYTTTMDFKWNEQDVL